jgi:hypothetical protein
LLVGGKDPLSQWAYTKRPKVRPSRRAAGSSQAGFDGEKPQKRFCQRTDHHPAPLPRAINSWKKRQPPGLFMFLIDDRDHGAVDAPPAHPIGKIADGLRVCLDIVFGIGDSQEEITVQVVQIGVAVGQHQRKAISQAFAAFEGRGFFHAFTVQSQCANGRIRPAENMTIVIICKIAIQVQVRWTLLNAGEVIVSDYIEVNFREKTRQSDQFVHPCQT